MRMKKTISGNILRSALIAIVSSGVLVGIICGSKLLAAPATSHSSAVAGMQVRTLTFTDRVAYQSAIDAIYWRHQIWPKENSRPKPLFAEAVSPAKIQEKVGRYLHNSQSLEQYGHQPITPDQLQAEMERMARESRNPGMLEELFSALGHDPFIVAECLVRPILSQRLITGIAAGNKQLDSQPQHAATMPTTFPAGYSLPMITAPLTDCTDDSWTPTSTGPDGRYLHTAVWTGSEMIVWGGFGASGSVNSGGRYDPATDSWTATSTTGAPSARTNHTAVWTGSEMIVWGGLDTSNNRLNNGGRYNPVTDTWTATSTVGAPSVRDSQTAVWTGSEMIIWGGDEDFSPTGTGGRYNPVTNSWTATSTAGAPAPRLAHSAVWTGSKMIVWGGAGFGSFYTDGGRYDPATDSWLVVSDSPELRFDCSTVWTGSEMIVWGGYGLPVVNGGFTPLNTGSRYDPTTDSWTATSTTNAPAPRGFNSGVWTGSEMIVWGGDNFNDGGRYFPAMDRWLASGTVNAPQGRQQHTAVWNGSQMIVWGGIDTSSGTYQYLASGGVYCPTAPVQITVQAAPAGFSFSVDGIAYSSTQMFFWTGGTSHTIATTSPQNDGMGQLYVWSNWSDGGAISHTIAPTTDTTYTATFAPPVQVTVQTAPAGLSFSVDGIEYNSSQTFSWGSGLSHTIATSSPQSGGAGVQYLWTGWSDNGAISHTVATTTDMTFTANFGTQYYLTVTHGSGGNVSPASGWRNSGSVVSITATPSHNRQISYSFGAWAGTGSGSYSGTNNPASVTMNGPITEDASFTQNPVQVTLQTSPAGLSFTVDGTSYSSAHTFSWVPGSNHNIATTQLQSGGPGTLPVGKMERWRSYLPYDCSNEAHDIPGNVSGRITSHNEQRRRRHGESRQWVEERRGKHHPDRDTRQRLQF